MNGEPKQNGKHVLLKPVQLWFPLWPESTLNVGLKNNSTKIRNKLRGHQKKKIRGVE